MKILFFLNETQIQVILSRSLKGFLNEPRIISSNSLNEFNSTKMCLQTESSNFPFAVVYAVAEHK